LNQFCFGIDCTHGEAVKEATRDGVPPIDPIDGDAPAEKLKKFSPGISVKMAEQV